MRVLDAHEDKDEREKAVAALRQEIPDFDARVEKERARASVKVEAEGKRGAPPGNQNAAKGEENKGSVSTFDSSSQGKKPKRDAAYWIARLKRDAVTDTHAAALLGSIESGDIKPYRAAIDMGWVKTPDPAVIIEKQYAKLDEADQVALWREWGRALPDQAVDRVAVAKEIILNLSHNEARSLMAWWQEARP